MRCSLAALGAMLQFAACTPTICSRTSDCNTGLVCTANGRCELPPDAALIDATGGDATSTTPADAAPADAALLIDASTGDAALVDGGGP